MAGSSATENPGGGDPTRLGSLELQVMELLWAGGEATVEQLRNALPGVPAYTTIATVLTNLRRKKLVTRRKDGHASLHSATMSHEEYTARVVDRALDASGNREAVMLHFVNRMGDDDVALLQEFLRARGTGPDSP